MKRRLRVFSCAKLIFTLIIEFDVPRFLFRCSPVCAIRPRNRKLETGRIPRLRILVCFDNPAPKIHAGCNLGPQINGFVEATSCTEETADCRRQKRFLSTKNAHYSLPPKLLICVETQTCINITINEQQARHKDGPRVCCGSAAYCRTFRCPSYPATKVSVLFRPLVPMRRNPVNIFAFAYYQQHRHIHVATRRLST